MHLVNVDTLQLETFLRTTPEYVILSHIWGDPEDELTFQGFKNWHGDLSKATRLQLRKLQGCCRLAKERDKAKYVWIDTCCIDKMNAVELQTAITSMLRWYRQAKNCYAYLTDVKKGDSQLTMAKSRWFRRGWTLQELLAPGEVCFYDKEWDFLGTKADLADTIRDVTTIPSLFLCGAAGLHEASLAQRMSWAAHRETTRPEDIAYCLFGLFGVSMDLRYGEGEEEAFIRLQRVIMEQIKDDSILAWGHGLSHEDSTAAPSVSSSPATFCGAIATSPKAFAASGHIVAKKRDTTIIKALEVSEGIIPMELTLRRTGAHIMGLLDCGPERRSRPDIVVGIPLRPLHPSDSNCSIFTRVSDAAPAQTCLRPTSGSSDRQELIRVKIHSPRKVAPELDRTLWVSIDSSCPRGYSVVEVIPDTAWRKAMKLIQTSFDPESGILKDCTFIIRLRDLSLHDVDDFLIVLRLPGQTAGIMTCARAFSARRLYDQVSILDGGELSSDTASNGRIALQVHFFEGIVVGQRMFVLESCEITGSPTHQTLTIDAGREIEILEDTVELFRNYAYEEKSAKRLGFCNQETRRLARDRADVNEKIQNLVNQIRQLQDEVQMWQDKKSQIVIDCTQAHDTTEKARQATKDAEQAVSRLKYKIRNHCILGKPLSSKATQAARLLMKESFLDPTKQGIANSGNAPLVYFVLMNQAKVVRQLLLEGADPNYGPIYTPLTAVLRYPSSSKMDIIKMLVEGVPKDDFQAGRVNIDPTLSFEPTYRSETPSDTSPLERATSPILAQLPYPTSALSGTLSTTSSMRADVNLADSKRLKPIDLAALSHDKHTCQYLIDHGACVDGNRLLDFAILRNNTQAASFFLQQNLAKPTTRHVHLAIDKSSLGVLKVLVDEGADVRKRHDGHTALGLAENYGKSHDVIASFLREEMKKSSDKLPSLPSPSSGRSGASNNGRFPYTASVITPNSQPARIPIHQSASNTRRRSGFDIAFERFRNNFRENNGS